MDPRILLVQSIALLFWESLIPESGKNSKEIVLNIINSLPAPEGVTATDDDRENLIALRDIAQSMALRNGEEQYDKDFLLSKVKLSIKKDPELRDDITGLLEGETTPDKVLLKVDLLQKELNKYFTQNKLLKRIQIFV
nr:MAG TPA: DNA polymerase B Like Replicative Helicase [Caudoviricetes sp.]